MWGQGVARALIDWVAGDAEEYGAAKLYWHTTRDNAPARSLYDKVARFKRFIVHTRKLNANAGSP